MNYIEVKKEEQETKMQDVYRYMPMFQMLNGSMVRIIAKEGNNVYYVK